MDVRAEILQLILRGMTFIRMVPGAHSRSTYILSFWINTFRAICGFCTLRLIIFGLSSGDITLFADGVAALAAHCQGTRAILLFDEERLSRIMAATEHFCSTAATEHLERRTFRFANCFRYLVYATLVVLIYLQALLLQVMPFPGLFPAFEGSFALFAGMQCIQYTYDAVAVVTCDLFFFCMVAMLYAQLAELNRRIRAIGDQEGLKYAMHVEMAMAVQRHAFLLSVCKDMIELYRVVLGGQFLITTASICLEAFVFGERDSQMKIAHFLYMIALLVQLSLYALPAEYLSNECARTALAVFHSGWYDNAHVAKTYVRHIIQRANTPVNFSGGGLVIINKGLYVVIFKNFLSLYALLKDLKATDRTPYQD